MNSHQEITIRQEQANDYPQVFELIRLAFINDPYSDHQEQLLVERLRKSKAFVPELALVAEVSGRVVGFILLTKIQIVDKTTTHQALALAPVAVHPDFQNAGIGGKLIISAHRIAKELNFKGIVLLGHAKYYPRFGYQPAAAFGITLPIDVPTENVMAKELQAHAFINVKGVVEYATEFFEF